MIFREIDFHCAQINEVPNDEERTFRMRINHIIDSIRLRMPKKIHSTSVIKLNCHACEGKTKNEFVTHEGIGMAYVSYPNAREIIYFNHTQAASAVINVLQSGVNIAAKYDNGIMENINKIMHIIDTSIEPFDFYRGIKRSHRSRKYKCEAIVHIQPGSYTSEILVSDKDGNSERISVKELKPLLYCADLGFNKLRWDNDTIIGLNGETPTFKLTPSIIRN